MAAVAQLCQTVVFGGDDRVQGLKHQAVGVFVEIQLHAQTVGIGELRQGLCRGQGNDHAVLLHETDLCHKLHVGKHAAGILLKEAHGFAGLEQMLHIGVGSAAYLHHQLVKAVVIGPSHAERKPAHATSHLFLYTHVLCLALELFLLEFVFLQQ